MSHVPALLKKLGDLHRQHVQTEREIATVEGEIIATTTTKSESKRQRRRQASAADVAKLTNGVVILLRDVGEPLAYREIAARLNLTPSVVSYRLQQAIGAGFVERVDRGRYRASSAVLASA